MSESSTECTGASASRRTLFGAVAASAAAVAVPQLSGQAPATPATSADSGLSLTPLGTNSGPPPLAARYGISQALVVNGRTYVVDCGRGAASQYLRAGLSMPSLTAVGSAAVPVLPSWLRTPGRQFRLVRPRSREEGRSGAVRQPTGATTRH
jgi:hypothetical protein